jgi:hypothetical protein
VEKDCKSRTQEEYKVCNEILKRRGVLYEIEKKRNVFFFLLLSSRS